MDRDRALGHKKLKSGLDRLDSTCMKDQGDLSHELMGKARRGERERIVARQ